MLKALQLLRVGLRVNTWKQIIKDCSFFLCIFILFFPLISPSWSAFFFFFFLKSASTVFLDYTPFLFSRCDWKLKIVICLRASVAAANFLVKLCNRNISHLSLFYAPVTQSQISSWFQWLQGSRVRGLRSAKYSATLENDLNFFLETQTSRYNQRTMLEFFEIVNLFSSCQKGNKSASFHPSIHLNPHQSPFIYSSIHPSIKLNRTLFGVKGLLEAIPATVLVEDEVHPAWVSSLWKGSTIPIVFISTFSQLQNKGQGSPFA